MLEQLRNKAVLKSFVDSLASLLDPCLPIAAIPDWPFLTRAFLLQSAIVILEGSSVHFSIALLFL